jgi:hypothetical protein
MRSVIPVGGGKEKNDTESANRALISGTSQNLNFEGVLD